MDEHLAEMLDQLANSLERIVEPQAIRYTDSVVGITHRVTTMEIAEGIRSLASEGLTLTPETQPLHDLLAARAEADVVLPNSVDDALDGIVAYMAYLGGGGKESILAFEAIVTRLSGT